MGKENKHNERKNRRKWPWVIPLCILVLIGFLRLFLMTGFAHRLVKHEIVETANQTINLRLRVGNLSGNILGHLTLTHITLSQDSTVASIDTLSLKYNLFSYFGQTFKIDNITIIHPVLKIRQQKDGTWNAEHWMKSSSDSSEGTATYAIHNLTIKRGKIYVSVPKLEQDSSFVIDNLKLAANRIRYSVDHYRANIEGLYFNVKQTRLDAPASVAASAVISDSLFNLSNLAVTTAHSVLNASGKINLADTTGHFKVAAYPLGWEDVAAYAKDLSVHKDINMTLDFHSGMSQGFVKLSAEAAGIRGFLAKATFVREPTLGLTSLKMSADRLDLGTFLNDTTTRSLQDLKLKATGRIPLDDYQQGHLTATFSAKNIHSELYQLDALKGTLLVDGNKAMMRIEPKKNGQSIIAKAKAKQIWDKKPSVSVSVEGSNINPAVWLKNETYTGRLNFYGHISGQGWFPESKLWSYEVVVKNSKLMGQKVDKALFRGRFSQHKLINQTDISFGDSSVHLEAGVFNLQEIPTFSYSLNIQHFNLANITGFEEYSSVINGLIQGRGRGNSLQNLQLKTTVQVDSSYLMQEPIQKIHFEAQIVDSVLTIQNANFISGIANGSLSARIHLQNFYDPDNRLNFHAQIKDISSFASLAGVDVLYGKGTVEAHLKSNNHGSLRFNARIDLQDIQYGDEFRARELYGQLAVDIRHNPHYSLNISMMKPVVSSVDLQKISLQTSGRLKDSITEGSFHIKLTGSEKGRITQRGTYRLNGDTTVATMTDFTLSVPGRFFTLVEPFHVRLINRSLQTDTLRIRSQDDSAYVAMAIQYEDSLHQSGFIKLQNLHLAPLQKVLLGQAYVKGNLVGHIYFNRHDTLVKAGGRVKMTGISYKGAKFKSVKFEANIKHNWLKSSFAVRRNGRKIVEAGMNIPFNLMSSDTAKKSLSRKNINGHLTVKPLELDKFNSLLKRLGISNTSGTFRLHGKLQGTVGQPQFKAHLSLLNGNLSGMSVDSLTASLNYQNKTSTLDLNATLTSLHQRMLMLKATVPFGVNIRTFDFSLPDAKDSILVNIHADDFNLKLLSDYMNHEMARNLKGFIDGDVTISGQLGNLQTNGILTLNKGAVRLVNIGIRLDHIQSTVKFQPDKIKIANLQMKSGNGRLHGHGQVILEKMEPKALNLSLEAQNFKVANTTNYQAIINADINVNGDVTSPKMTGKLTVLSGFVELYNFGEKSVEDIQLDTTLAAPATRSSLYDSLSLNLDLSINDHFYVQNERYLKMEFGLEGDLKILKNKSEPLQIFGTVKTVDGYAEPLGKHFELQKGVLAFTGPPANPQLDIRTLYKPPRANQEVKIWYIIKGTVEDPQFKYKSEPPMDLSSILSYTLFGQPMYALSPGAQSAASAIGHKLATNFVMGFLANKVESIATTKLGIDVVKIEPTHVGGKSGTAITTGWYLNPKVFFAIQNIITGATPSPGFYLEYSLRENLKLILSQGTGDREGIGADIQWEYDY